jgi:hypothetical protein
MTLPGSITSCFARGSLAVTTPAMWHDLAIASEQFAPQCQGAYR